MFEIIISSIFLILMIFLFLRMIILAIYESKRKKNKGLFIKIFIEKTDLIFKNFDSKFNLSIGKVKFGYIILILLLMLIQKLVLLIAKN